MKIERGCFYRFRNTSTIWGILAIFPEHERNGRTIPARADVAIVSWGYQISQHTASHEIPQLETWLTCKVSPTWVDVGPDDLCIEEDPRQQPVPGTSWLDEAASDG